MRRGKRVRFVVGTVLFAFAAGICVPGNGKAPPAGSDAALLEDVQRRTFRFFWETTDPETGLTPDRWPSGEASSIAAVGFSLTSYCVGVERGWVTRDEAAERVLRTLRFFSGSPQSPEAEGAAGYRGFYYHFLLMESGRRWRRCELSSIDTALLMMGVLSTLEYFDRDTRAERSIRDLADRLYRRVEWDWMQPRKPLVAMAWRPERQGFESADYRGYDEAMFLYILAIGSPTHAIDPAAWQAFTADYDWASFYGYEHANFAPLFGHQYAACWIDPRGLQDAFLRKHGIDYFENSRRATLAQRAYAIENPGGWEGYGKNVWGLTACDGPANVSRSRNGTQRRFHTYWARGACHNDVRDDGTVAPTAALGSMPFAPKEAIGVLRTLLSRHGDRLYTDYGFLDAFNPSFRGSGAVSSTGDVDAEEGWVAQDHLGIDQGPILLMIENHRSRFVWDLIRKSPYIQTGLRRAGLKYNPTESTRL